MDAEASGPLPPAVLLWIQWINRNRRTALLVLFVGCRRVFAFGVLVMSVLDDFARMRLYRKRAAEFEQLADTTLVTVAQRRYRTIARHYRELADREERADKARMAEHLELLRLRRREAAE
jgi:hypothetical protein